MSLKISQKEADSIKRANRALLKAIRKNCLDCSGGQIEEAKNCSFRECPLFKWRM